MSTIIEDRWNHYREGVENPFDVNAAADVFVSPRTIARTVKVLSEMLRLRQMHYPSDKAWPTNPQLAIGAEEMKEYLDYFNDLLDLD